MSEETEGAVEAPSAEPVRRGVSVGRRGLLAWGGLLVVAVALDGWVGAVAAMAVAALVVSGVPRRIVGGLGVACLFASMVAVLVRGLPSDATVSPAFASRSLLPHHLMFAGLVLVGAWVVLELAPHLISVPDRAERGRAPAPEDAPPRWSARVAAVAVGLVAVAAVVASWVVLQP